MIQTEADFLQKAMKAYDNPSCIRLEEFQEDLNQIISIKRTLKKYQAGKETNMRKTINMFVLLYNCFGATATELLLHKIYEEDLREYLIPIIIYLGWHSEIIDVLGISYNEGIAQELERL